MFAALRASSYFFYELGEGCTFIANRPDTIVDDDDDGPLNLDAQYMGAGARAVFRVCGNVFTWIGKKIDGFFIWRYRVVSNLKRKLRIGAS